MYCKNCGSQIDDKAVVCVNCGVEVKKAQTETKTNTIAIVGFVLSFFIALAGLICSIIGLKKVDECNSGKGLAIAGIIISIVSMVIYIIYFIAIIAAAVALM